MTSASEAPSRIAGTSHPAVYEVNTRVLLHQLSGAGGKPVTLDGIPDRVIEEWAGLGFDAVWLMGVWTTGKIGQDIARAYKPLQEEFRAVLPDLVCDDVLSSPYSVQSYAVSPAVGGSGALRKLRKRLEKKGLGLILDFVCNHTARDHEWVEKHPEYYIAGPVGQDTAQPDSYFRARTVTGDRVIAFGRDPSYPAWTDTAQLNHEHAATRRALIATLREIADQCDGVRCDMAMLTLRDVFKRTWGDASAPPPGQSAQGEFWKEAISAVKTGRRSFTFIAEAYWNLEWQLQQLGFDYTYDKTLYDRLLREGAGSVRDHLKADPDFQRHSLRFIENHDEPRAARVLPSSAWQFAAATIVATIPGMVLFHDGQLEGRTVRVPLQLRRRPDEQASERSLMFYRRLLACICQPVIKDGEWQLLNIRPAWHENPSWQNFLAFWWRGRQGGARLIVVNYAPLSGQCYVELPVDRITGSPVEFRDLMGDAVYVRDRAGLESRGMYFELPGYGIHIFEVMANRKPLS